MALVSESPYKTNYEIMALENDQHTHTANERVKGKEKRGKTFGELATEQPNNHNKKILKW